MFKIEKRVKLPEGLAERAAIYPFRSMKPGDSFLVPVPKGVRAIVVQKRIIRAAASFKERTKSKATFTTRQTPAGVRCWLVK